MIRSEVSSIKPSYIGTCLPVRRVLNFQEAKVRLHTLKPGSQEYRQLESALFRITGIVEIVLPQGSYKIDTSLRDGALLGGFGSSEHIAIGKAVELRGIGVERILIIRDTTKVAFEHIIALAGDFYAIPGAAISLPGGDSRERKKRFMDSFNTLFKGNANQIRGVLNEIEQEFVQVSRSSTPRHCYSCQMIEKNNLIKKIKDDIDELLVDNSDHFEKNAIDAYKVGHEIALAEAAKAGKIKDIEGLKKAYAIDAFACHFLTDLFASGHTRNQRGALELFLLNTLKFDAKQAKVLSGLLTGAQHEKEGKEGLTAQNNKKPTPDRWSMYGDGYFFLPQSEENKRKVIEATQSSVDDVYQSYLYGSSMPIDQIMDLLPIPTPANPQPLYTIEGDKLTLFHRHLEIDIKTKEDYLKHGVSLALSHLPETYVTGFIQGYIDVQPPVLVSKVVLPVLDLLTGCAWRIAGIASRQQLKEVNQEINSQLQDVASVLSASYEMSKQIISIAQEIQAAVNRIELQQKWDKEFGEIRESIATIMDAMHKLSKSSLSEFCAVLDQYGPKVMEANDRLSRVLMDGTTTGTNLVTAYQDLILLQQNSMPQKMVIATTLWYRWLIDLQTRAFGIYKLNWITNHQKSKQFIEDAETAFEKDILAQITKHIEKIDPALIHKPIRYIRIQYDNINKKEIAFKNFLNQKQ